MRDGVGRVFVDGEGDGCVADGFAEEPGDALLFLGGGGVSDMVVDRG